MADPIISLRDVSKTYEVPRRAFLGTAASLLAAVRGFTLDVAPGEFVSVIGPSGCGKTTVLQMVAGLRAPSAGEILVNGKAPARAVRDGDSTVIFQQPVLFEWLSTEENVMLPFRLRDPRWWLWPWRRRLYRDRVRDLLRTVDLEGFERYHPDRLSGGMQQRAAIARALTLDPKVLLMDEPFGALDEITRDRMNLELLRVHAQGRRAIVFVTHSIEEAVFLADRVVVMAAPRGRGAGLPAGESSILRIVPVALPRPRGLEAQETPEFFEAVRRGREALREAQRAERADSAR